MGLDIVSIQQVHSLAKCYPHLNIYSEIQYRPTQKRTGQERNRLENSYITDNASRQNLSQTLQNTTCAGGRRREFLSYSRRFVLVANC